MSRNIVILAAGKSSRMNSKIPKVLHLIAERPALGYILETASLAKPDKIILVTSPSMHDVRQFAATQYPEIINAIQTEALGTGDAVKSALAHIPLEGNTIIMYGDTPFVTLETIKQIDDHSVDLTLIAFYSNAPEQYGRVITYNNDLMKIVEFNDSSDEEKLVTLCNSGIYSIRNTHLHTLLPLINNHNSKHEFYLTDIVKLAVQHNLSSSVVTVDQNEVTGINTRKDLSLAQEIMQKRIKDRLMEQGVTIINPESSYIAYDFQAGYDTTIYPNVFIGSKVALGNEVTIRSFSHIEGAQIANNVNIGPFARIRPDTEIATKAHIGNFVEIKNSKISHSSKISHLSYIGDTVIGSNTNIGAGSITCNYDGIKKKSKTIIGNNVAIGSNSCLIAPINIADGAYIAAGSVITHNVAENDLAFGRARQVTLKGKAKKRDE